MTDLLHFSLTVFTGFFAIMNPIAIAPVFVGLVQGKDEKTKQAIARTACVTAFSIVVIFVVLGKYIFDLFGISVPAFKITGGVLLFYVGFEMLMSKKSNVHSPDNNNDGIHSDDSSVAISPLAIPVLAGPGTIVTAVNHAAKASAMHLVVIITVFGLMVFLTYLAFILSDKIVKLMGDNLIAVVGKLMGLILAIIGTSMVIAGVKLSFGL